MRRRWVLSLELKYSVLGIETFTTFSALHFVSLILLFFVFVCGLCFVGGGGYTSAGGGSGGGMGGGGGGGYNRRF